MAPEERSSAIQIPLLCAILVIPGICLILLVLSFFKLFGSKEKLVRFSVVFLSITEFVIYAYYESGISIWTNIRVDLLLVYPALMLNLIILIIGIVLSVLTLRIHGKTNKCIHTDSGSSADDV